MFNSKCHEAFKKISQKEKELEKKEREHKAIIERKDQ